MQRNKKKSIYTNFQMCFCSLYLKYYEKQAFSLVILLFLYIFAFQKINNTQNNVTIHTFFFLLCFTFLIPL